MSDTIFSIDYDMFPPQFQHCMLAECPHSAVCLRYRAFVAAPAEKSAFTLLNPTMLKQQDLTDCRFLYQREPETLARGIKNSMERLPQQQLQKVRNALIAAFGRTRYYRFLRNESWLDEAAQKQIRKIFTNYGVENFLVFDETKRTY